MNEYYRKTLAAERLKKCYDIAPPRIRQYLAAEINFVLKFIGAGDRVLDLGCGYGRIFPDLQTKTNRVIGIDNAEGSLQLAKQMLAGKSGCRLAAMDAGRLAFTAACCDVVVCIQNGISAFHVEPSQLIRECLRVAKENGTILFSTYAGRFWEERLHWFRLQAAAGLLGEIDEEKTGNGQIICKDGFRATTFSAQDFQNLAVGIPAKMTLAEVDGSSLFCVMQKNGD